MEKEQDNKLSSLSKDSGHLYQKPTFTGQYLNFNFHHLHNVKKKELFIAFNIKQKSLVVTAMHIKKKCRV